MKVFFNPVEARVRTAGNLFGNELGNPCDTVVVYYYVVVVVFLRFDKSFGYRIANAVTVDGGRGYRAYDVYDCARNLIGNLFRIEFGQVVGKHGRRLVGYCVLVYSRDGNLLAYTFRHLLVIGSVDGGKVERLAQFVGDNARNHIIVEVVRYALGYGRTTLVVYENFKILGFERTDFKRNRVGKLFLVHVVRRVALLYRGIAYLIRNALCKRFLVD